MNPDPDEHVHPGQEDLQWGHGIKEKNREKKPHAAYSAISEQARKMIPGESQCKMFCGGKSCKYCTSETWTPEQMVIDGLYSEWVTDNILAMARMSNENIEKYKMVKQFQELGVKTIINLQQPGEHAFCGFGNDQSGFSYNPQTFMEANFFFYNFAMVDYGVAPMATLLDIVKVMQFAVSLGKVAVHCHAGLGRTGLIIACYLIYNNRVRAGKAIQYVRSRRPKSIQTKQQMNTCHEFEQHLKLYFIIFTSKAEEAHPVSFSRFLTRQRHLLHGYEARKLKHIPKVIYVCCERLLELCGQGRSLSSLRNKPLDPIPADLESLYSSSTTARDSSPSVQSGLMGQERPESGVATPRMDGSPRPHQSLHDSTHKTLGESLSSSRTKNDKKSAGKTKVKQSLSYPANLRSCDKSPDGMDRLKPGGSSNDIHSASSDGDMYDDDDDNDDDDCIVYGQSSKQAELEAQKAEEEEIKIYKERSYSMDDQATLRQITVEEVCQAAMDTDYSHEVLERIEKLEDTLNKTDQAWQDLAREENPDVLYGIICDWFYELNEPVLRGQDIYTLVENCSDPQKALLRLEKNTKHFLEYIILVISKLQPVSERLLHAVVELFLSYLCQKKLNLGKLSISSQQFGDLKYDHAHLLFQLFLQLLDGEKHS